MITGRGPIGTVAELLQALDEGEVAQPARAVIAEIPDTVGLAGPRPERFAQG